MRGKVFVYRAEEIHHAESFDLKKWQSSDFDLILYFEKPFVTLESTFIDDLGADSLDVFQIIMGLEEEFDIEIPDDQVEKIKTVGDIVKFIEEKVD